MDRVENEAVTSSGCGNALRDWGSRTGVCGGVPRGQEAGKMVGGRGTRRGEVMDLVSQRWERTRAVSREDTWMGGCGTPLRGRGTGGWSLVLQGDGVAHGEEVQVVCHRLQEGREANEELAEGGSKLGLALPTRQHQMMPEGENLSSCITKPLLDYSTMELQ